MESQCLQSAALLTRTENAYNQTITIISSHVELLSKGSDTAPVLCFSLAYMENTFIIVPLILAVGSIVKSATSFIRPRNS